jgi:hypothetical protein
MATLGSDLPLLIAIQLCFVSKKKNESNSLCSIWSTRDIAKLSCSKKLISASLNARLARFLLSTALQASFILLARAKDCHALSLFSLALLSVCSASPSAFLAPSSALLASSYDIL